MRRQTNLNTTRIQPCTHSIPHQMTGYIRSSAIPTFTSSRDVIDRKCPKQNIDFSWKVPFDNQKFLNHTPCLSPFSANVGKWIKSSLKFDDFITICVVFIRKQYRTNRLFSTSSLLHLIRIPASLHNRGSDVNSFFFLHFSATRTLRYTFRMNEKNGGALSLFSIITLRMNLPRVCLEYGIEWTLEWSICEHSYVVFTMATAAQFESDSTHLIRFWQIKISILDIIWCVGANICIANHTPPRTQWPDWLCGMDTTKKQILRVCVCLPFQRSTFHSLCN